MEIEFLYRLNCSIHDAIILTLFNKSSTLQFDDDSKGSFQSSVTKADWESEENQWSLIHFYQYIPSEDRHQIVKDYGSLKKWTAFYNLKYSRHSVIDAWVSSKTNLWRCYPLRNSGQYWSIVSIECLLCQWSALVNSQYWMSALSVVSTGQYSVLNVCSVSGQHWSIVNIECLLCQWSALVNIQYWMSALSVVSTGQ